MHLRDFEIVSQLGEGSFSTVYKVRRVIDNTLYAMKKVRITQMDLKDRDNALNEVRLLASIKHPNVIGYKEAFVDENSDSLYIIMEYAEGGDLYKRIQKHLQEQTIFPEEQIWAMVIQVLRALKTLHELGILHRDLKSANVYFMKEGIVKLGDLNISKLLKSRRGMAETRTGTPYYASPEVWKNDAYDKKSDIWSLGCVLYEMMTLKAPFRSSTIEKLHNKIVRCIYARVPQTYSKSLSTILEKTLQPTPECRMSAESLLDLKATRAKFRCVPRVEAESLEFSLLQTIHGSEEFSILSERLPKARYEKKYDIERTRRRENSFNPVRDSSSQKIDDSLNMSTEKDEGRAIVLRFAKKLKGTADSREGKELYLPKINSLRVEKCPQSARQSPSFRSKGIYNILENRYV